MREHQIVISLKPEQFEEVQRLARAAGSKSISAFLRQQIIASLGLGNNAGPVAASASGPDIKQLTGELRRLHRELQIFVADSLSKNDFATSVASMEGSIPFPIAVQENFLAEGAPLMPESSYTHSLMPSPEQYSGAQTPIMPAAPMLPGQVSQAFERGSMFSSSSFSLPTTSGYEDALDDADAYTIAKQAMQANSVDANRAVPPVPSTPIIQVQQTTSHVPPATEASSSQSPYAVPPSSEQPPYAIPPSLNPPSVGFESSIPPAPPSQQTSGTVNRIAYTEPEAPPEPTSQAAQVQQSVQSFAENDELEELADRAFAISPRLGPLHEAVRKFPDPLKDLLDDAFLNGLDEEESESQEEPAVVTASDQQTQTVVVEQEFEDFAEEKEAAFAQVGTSKAFVESEPDEDAPAPDPEGLESGAQSEDATDPDPPSDDPPLPLPPPISGGPPPRKRRT